MQLHCVVSILLAAPAIAAAGSGVVYADAGDTAASAEAQAAAWGGLCAHGHEQSPIDVVTSATAKTATPSIQTRIEAEASYVKNTGNGFQLFETSPGEHNWNNATSEVDAFGGTPKGHSFIGGSKYNFYQVHWHTPSENTIDGQHFPLEAHFVHQLDDPALHGTYHGLAVIGLMYEMGAEHECNEFLDEFWGMFPVSAGVAAYTGGALDFNDKLTEELSHGYYHWYGSLTTPPCSEGVSWNLLKKREKVCPQQVERLQEALKATQGGLGFNNRVVQPMYHRTVAETGVGNPSRPVVDKTLEAQEGTKWLYATEGEAAASHPTQAETWKGLCAVGHEQSPINVETKDVRVAGEPVIETHIDASASYVRNTGHGFQLFETNPNNSAYVNGDVMVDDFSGSAKGYSMIAGNKWNFYQVHWHTPSENTIDGEFFPLEAHFVHQLDDPAIHGTYHRLAVIGLLYEAGRDDECNEFLDKFWGAFPIDQGVAEYTGTDFDLNAKLTEELSHGYYHWYGSLTTPPCSEGVSWNLLKKREKVCPRQVERLQEALHATQGGLGFNNRVVQPLNHRVVTMTAPAQVPGRLRGSAVGEP